MVHPVAYQGRGQSHAGSGNIVTKRALTAPTGPPPMQGQRASGRRTISVSKPTLRNPAARYTRTAAGLEA